MTLSSHRKILLGFAMVMAAAGMLAFAALGWLYYLDRHVDKFSASSGGSQEAAASWQQMRILIGRGYWLVLGVGATGTLISLGCIYWIWSTLGRVLREVGATLQDSSAQVLESANTLSEQSQLLAENAGKAAANIEDNNSSIEQLANITSRNAENASRAKALAQETRGNADMGASDMQNLSDTMNEIQSGSDDVARIVKTIDEIAFQTNLLALNAAVEAARAGEAGLGFAVVADEVRSLAQRCASSARETAERIAAAVQKTRHGVDLAAKVSAGLQRIVDGNQKLDTLAAEVADASKEQHDGIELLRRSAQHMDQMTQDNAANAEAAAESTRSLRDQADRLSDAVFRLRQMVEGRRAQNSIVSRSTGPVDAVPGDRKRERHLAEPNRIG